MNKFELFSMIFYTLNHYWKDNKSEELGHFLSDMNPFLFDDIGSAVPNVYLEFCKTIDDDITIENSFNYAKKYISNIALPYVNDAFAWVDESEWKVRVERYLATEHKGKEND